MEFVEVYVSPYPWTGQRVSLGRITAEPAQKCLTFFEDSQWRVQITDFRGTDERQLAEEEIEELELCVRSFFDALKTLLNGLNSKPETVSLRNVVAAIPDRGTAIYLSGIQNVRTSLPSALAARRAG